MALVLGASFSALTFVLGYSLGKTQGLSITLTDKRLQVENKDEQVVTTPEVKEIKKPTQSRVMNYPKPVDVRKQKALEVEDIFFKNVIGGTERTSGTMDARNLM